MEFESPPSLAPAYLRALLDRRPARMPAGYATPLIEGRLAACPIDPARLRRYRAVCGFGPGDLLPVTYPHVLAAGLQMRLLSGPAFPVRLIGLVHVGNVIRQSRAVPAAARPEFRCHLEGSRTIEAGEEFCLHTHAIVDGEVCWQEETTFIARGGGQGRSKSKSRSKSGRPELPACETVGNWVVPADIGRRYARVSGDYNPIHLSRLTGRLFGFPGAIAHGMWSLARCAAELGPEADRSVRLAVRFLRPLVLPATVAFRRGTGPSAEAFLLTSPDGQTVFLSGSAAPT